MSVFSSINCSTERHWQCVARLGPVVHMFNILREGFQLSGSGLRWTSFWGKWYMWWKSYRVQRVPNSSVSRLRSLFVDLDSHFSLIVIPNLFFWYSYLARMGPVVSMLSNLWEWSRNQSASLQYATSWRIPAVYRKIHRDQRMQIEWMYRPWWVFR